MQPEEKSTMFQRELEYIENKNIKTFTKKAIELLPDYFFKIPASTSRKYHPNFAAGEGGLVRHTQAVTRIAKELFRLEMFDIAYTKIEQDIILASLILHDGNKAGDNGQHTVAEHPLLMSEFLSSNQLKDIIPDEQLSLIKLNVEKHMGQWTKDWKTGREILKKPQTKMEKFVHLCDYIASRKCVEMNLDAPLST